MVGAVARDQLHLLGPALQVPVETGGLERPFVRFRARVREEHALEVVVREPAELRRQLDRGDVREAGVVVHERGLAHLLRGRIRELRTAVPDGDVPERGERVDVATPPHVGEPDALPMVVDHGVGVVRCEVLRVDEVREVGLLEAGDRRIVEDLGLGGRHRSLLSRRPIVEAA